MKARIIFGITLFLSLFIVIGCHKKDDPVPVQETGTVTDVEGNIYRTIKIGNQWWMAENLSVKMYRDGTFIPNITDSTSWAQNIAGAYCEYDNGNSQSAAPGLLYNWYAVNAAANIAPAGWHIPTDDEWRTLEQFIGMGQDESAKSGWRGTHEGDKLKIESPKGWSTYHDVWSTNESGFAAMAGSCRLPNATFGQPGLFSTGFWWSHSETIGTDAWYRYLDYKNSNIFRSHDSKAYGFSVRCVKD
ncbi:fibrobacter succinogenes major paralogous domain-containing protein [soil metagenome]